MDSKPRTREQILRRGDITRVGARLTKRYLFELPEGRYLVSNVCGPHACPAFESKIGPPETREQLWLTLRRRGVAQRLCWVFKTKADFVRDFQHWRSPVHRWAWHGD